jgi:hypothetical protein
MLLTPLPQTTKSAIKAYFRDRLIAPNGDGAFPTLVGGSVYVDRYGPFQAEELPVIDIFGTEETCEYIDVTEDRRHYKIQIEIQCAAEDADVQMDVIGDQIIDLFRNDEYLGGGEGEDGLVEWCRYARGQLYYDEKRHLNAICWAQDWDVRYIWQSTPDPSVSRMAPFKEMMATYEFEELNPQAPIVVPEFTDEIDIPQV